MKFLIRKNIIKRILLILFLFIPLIINSTNKDSLANEINLLEGEKKVLLIHKLTRTYFFEDPIKARDLSLQALEHSKKIQNDSLIAYSYNYLGLAYYFLDYWKLSVENYKKSMATEHAKNSAYFNAALANNIAIDYEMLGEYDKSAEYYYKGLKILEGNNDSLFIAKTYMNLGLLDIQMNKPTEAVDKFTFALPIFQKENDIRNVASSYQNLSIAEFALNNIAEAERNTKIALHYAKQLDNIKMAEIYLDYSNGLFNHKKYKKALKNYQNALSFSDSITTQATYFHILQGIGKSYLYLNNIKKAERYLLLADNGLEKIDASLWLEKNKLNLARLYAKIGNWNQFNLNLEAYSKLHNEHFKKEELRNAEEVKVIYKTEKKNQQIKLQEVEIKNKSRRLVFVSIIAVLVSVGLFIALFLSRKLKFANKNLVEKNLELSERWKQLQKFYGSAESDTSITSQNDLFRKIYRYMVDEQAYTNSSITVDYLSKQLSSNTKYISKAIKEETGMNFNTFINTFRIEEAKRILRDKISSTWSLDAVAEQSGFNNTTSFFQAFKKNTGLTPSAFRSALVTTLYK